MAFPVEKGDTIGRLPKRQHVGCPARDPMAPCKRLAPAKGHPEADRRDSGDSNSPLRPAALFRRRRRRLGNSKQPAELPAVDHRAHSEGKEHRASSELDWPQPLPHGHEGREGKRPCSQVSPVRSLGRDTSGIGQAAPPRWWVFIKCPGMHTGAQPRPTWHTGSLGKASLMALGTHRGSARNNTGGQPMEGGP